MSNLKNKIRAKQFVITAEIVPPLSAAGAKLKHEADQLKGKVDAINLTDAAAAKLEIDVLPAAASVRLIASTLPLSWPASCSSFVPAADSGGTISAVITNFFA